MQLKSLVENYYLINERKPNIFTLYSNKDYECGETIITNLKITLESNYCICIVINKKYNKINHHEFVFFEIYRHNNKNLSNLQLNVDAFGDNDVIKKGDPFAKIYLYKEISTNNYSKKIQFIPLTKEDKLPTEIEPNVFILYSNNLTVFDCEIGYDDDNHRPYNQYVETYLKIILDPKYEIIVVPNEEYNFCEKTSLVFFKRLNSFKSNLLHSLSFTVYNFDDNNVHKIKLHAPFAKLYLFEKI